MRPSIPVTVAVAALGVGVLAGCGVPTSAGGSAVSTSSASAPAALPSSPGQSAAPGSGTSRSPAPSGSPAPTAQALAGFTPWSFTAVSITHWWLLGGVPCGPRECPAIVTTTDGGATFSRLPAPGGPFGPGLNSAPAAASIRFADPNDGWAYGPALYATQDGGLHWTPISMPGQVTGVEPALGRVFAITSASLPCSRAGTCTSADMTPNLWTAGWPQIDSWRTDPSAGPVSGGLAVHGRSVWVINSMDTRDGPAIGTGLLHSVDGGGHFAVEPQPIPGIDCAYSPVSDSVLWSYCSGGHFMFAFVSTDGGAHFSPLRSGDTGTTPDGYPNGSTLAAASPAVAVAASDLPGDSLIRTTDGGATWTVVQRPPDGSGTWALVGFTTPRVGYALWQHQKPSYPASTAQLWRTTNGGATWSPVTTAG